MGRRGPAPKPTALKLIEGNPGCRPINAYEPKPPAADDPRPPTWLDAGGRREWRKMVPHLRVLGLLTVVDVTALSMYCDSVSTALAYAKVCREKGRTMKAPTGYVMLRPEATALAKEKLIIRSYMQEFGLTPSARSRMSVGEKEEETLGDILGRQSV